MLIPHRRAAAAFQRRLRRQLGLWILPSTLLLLGGAASAQGFLPQQDSRQQPTIQDVPIRVLLQQAERLQIGAGSGRLQISDARGGLLLELAPGEELRLTPGASGLSLDRRGAKIGRAHV